MRHNDALCRRVCRSGPPVSRNVVFGLCPFIHASAEVSYLPGRHLGSQPPCGPDGHAGPQSNHNPLIMAGSPEGQARNLMSDSLDTPSPGTLPPAALSLTTPAGLQSIDVLTRRRRIVFALNVVTYVAMLWVAASCSAPAAGRGWMWSCSSASPPARRGRCSASGTRSSACGCCISARTRWPRLRPTRRRGTSRRPCASRPRSS